MYIIRSSDFLVTSKLATFHKGIHCNQSNQPADVLSTHCTGSNIKQILATTKLAFLAFLLTGIQGAPPSWLRLGDCLFLNFQNWCLVCGKFLVTKHLKSKVAVIGKRRWPTFQNTPTQTEQDPPGYKTRPNLCDPIWPQKDTSTSTLWINPIHYPSSLCPPPGSKKELTSIYRRPASPPSPPARLTVPGWKPQGGAAAAARGCPLGWDHAQDTTTFEEALKHQTGGKEEVLV